MDLSLKSLTPGLAPLARRTGRLCGGPWLGTSLTEDLGGAEAGAGAGTLALALALLAKPHIVLPQDSARSCVCLLTSQRACQ